MYFGAWEAAKALLTYFRNTYLRDLNPNIIVAVAAAYCAIIVGNRLLLVIGGAKQNLQSYGRVPYQLKRTCRDCALVYRRLLEQVPHRKVEAIQSVVAGLWRRNWFCAVRQAPRLRTDGYVLTWAV